MRLVRHLAAPLLRLLLCLTPKPSHRSSTAPLAEAPGRPDDTVPVLKLTGLFLLILFTAKACCPF